MISFTARDVPHHRPRPKKQKSKVQIDGLLEVVDGNRQTGDKNGNDDANNSRDGVGSVGTDEENQNHSQQQEKRRHRGGGNDNDNENEFSLFQSHTDRRVIPSSSSKSSKNTELKRLLKKMGVSTSRKRKDKNSASYQRRKQQQRQQRYRRRSTAMNSDNDTMSQSSGGSTTGRTINLPNRTIIFTSLVVLVGLAASTLVLGFGISGAVDKESVQFQIHASELVAQLQSAWKDFETASRWVHQSCRNNNFSRAEFRDLYEYVLEDGLELQAIQWVPHVDHIQRESYENDSRTFYSDFYSSTVKSYTGFKGFEPNLTNSIGLSLQQRSEQPFYYPIHNVEPVVTNEGAIDFDLYSSSSGRRAVDKCLQTWHPAVSSRVHLVQDEGTERLENQTFYSVWLLNPGIRLSGRPELQQKDLSLLSIRISGLLSRSLSKATRSISVFLYDHTNNYHDPKHPDFLGAAIVNADGKDGSVLEYLPEQSLSSVLETELFHRETKVAIASSEWTVVVVALEDTFVPTIRFILLAGKLIILACLSLAVWIFTNLRRTQRINELISKAESEKASIIVNNARASAKAEHELNDYIAHEVRNPLAAAISACNFVKIQVNEAKPLVDEEAIQSAREDVDIIDSSLRFCNDLLRNMLDMHKAASKKLKMELVPMDLEQDILKPAAAMLYRRDAPFEVIIDCPKNCIAMTDRLRLKQIVLNLGRNASKFVHKGFIRLRAAEEEGSLRVFVEDSGPGIPMGKRKNLFAKFQESLDAMDQGTGIGLCLCKNMAQLLKGDIWLDESFDSGVEGCPGTRFVVDLKIKPMTPEEYEDFLNAKAQNAVPTLYRRISTHEDHGRLLMSTQQLQEQLAKRHPSNSSLFSGGKDGENEEEEEEKFSMEESVAFKGEEQRSHSLYETTSLEGPALPETLSVLFVDDDLVLRKLFMRSLKRIVPGWTIQEAANGEAAMLLIGDDVDKYDIIFMDQYMASVEKQMLGTETVRELRRFGVTCCICGLSANDKEREFLTSGADFFMFKPLPFEKELLEKELWHLLYAPRHQWKKPSTLKRNPSGRLGGVLKRTSSVGRSTPTKASSVSRVVFGAFTRGASLGLVGGSEKKVSQEAVDPNQEAAPSIEPEVAPTSLLPSESSSEEKISQQTDQKQEVPPTQTTELAPAQPAPAAALQSTSGTAEELPETTSSTAEGLPEKFSVLFVDDDKVLRKLFMRSLKRSLPTWTISEASSGEEAVEKINDDVDKYDLIFMDQYMASVDKKMLGTETVVELRRLGVTCCICGLSANDKEDSFLMAGADFFILKPLPFEKELLKKELARVLYSPSRSCNNPPTEVDPSDSCSQISPASATDEETPPSVDEIDRSQHGIRPGYYSMTGEAA